jgi:hypothetical protein
MTTIEAIVRTADERVPSQSDECDGAHAERTAKRDERRAASARDPTRRVVIGHVHVPLVADERDPRTPHLDERERPGRAKEREGFRRDANLAARAVGELQRKRVTECRLARTAHGHDTDTAAAGIARRRRDSKRARGIRDVGAQIRRGLKIGRAERNDGEDPNPRGHAERHGRRSVQLR